MGKKENNNDRFLRRIQVQSTIIKKMLAEIEVPPSETETTYDITVNEKILTHNEKDGSDQSLKK